MKKLFLSTIASLLALVSTMSLAEGELEGIEFTGNVALTNDYKFYGFSQSDEGFAISGGFDVSHESGLYLGVWASSIDFALDAVHHLNAEPGTAQDPATL